MTQQQRRVLKNAAMVFSLAMIATPLAIDQHGGVGISQALAQGGHRGHSASRGGSGEGSPNDVVADAKEKKAAIDASQDAAIMKRVNMIQQRLDAAELKASGLTKAQIEREENTLQKILKNS